MASSSSSSNSRSARSRSATDSPSSSFTGFPQTFSSTTTSNGPGVTALPGNGGNSTGDAGSGGDNGAGGGGGGGQGGIQSSAQLYLYTFLATLILLLAVSSAIVVRSLLLRRRHRRMVAEAIANGTWVPPAPRLRVDLRKKPRLWDAFLAPPPVVPIPSSSSANAGGGVGGMGEGEGKDEWDAIMPFAASYTPSAPTLAPVPTSTLAPPPSSAPGTGTSPNSRSASRVNLSSPASATNLNAAPSAALEKPVQPRVRVAVLIAMPAPGMFSDPPTAISAASAATSPNAPALHPTSPTTPTAPTWALHLPPTDDPDEQGLPHLEMGVVSVGVVPAHEEEGRASEEEDGQGRK